jgi:hypothetical protein
MFDFSKMANAGLFLSHADFYQTTRSLKEILNGSHRTELLYGLSLLSFVHDEEKRFRHWALATFCKSQRQRERAVDRAVYSRLQCWRMWSLILNEWETDANGERRLGTEVLHEAFALLNDRKDDVYDEAQQALVKAITSQSRDNPVSKLRRAQHIFLDSESLRPFIKGFEQRIGVPLKMYVNVTFYLVQYWHGMRYGKKTMPSFEDWTMTAELLSKQIHTSLDQVKLILKDISFSADEGRAFAKSTENQPNEFMLYRERPLFEIMEGVYVPVEGKLLEELLFENLFYRIHKANGQCKEFLTLFGDEFEKYAQQYAIDFMQGLPQYKVIEEFIFGSKKKRIHSPDLIISIPEKSALAVFEIKSARPFYESLSTENTPKSLESSMEKLYGKPLKQAYTAVQNILKQKAHSSFDEHSKYTFISVTMNNYPMSFMEYSVDDGSGNNLSSGLHSFDIETFEVLMQAARYTTKYNILDMLLWSYQQRHLMSTKTFLKRLIDDMGADGLSPGLVLTKMNDATLKRHQSYFHSFAI